MNSILCSGYCYCGYNYVFIVLIFILKCNRFLAYLDPLYCLNCCDSYLLHAFCHNFFPVVGCKYVSGESFERRHSGEGIDYFHFIWYYLYLWLSNLILICFLFVLMSSFYNLPIIIFCLRNYLPVSRCSSI